MSTFQLFEMFPDAEAARLYLESRLWLDGPCCPVCKLGERITARKGGFYRCNACREDFTVRTGTIFCVCANAVAVEDACCRPCRSGIHVVAEVKA